MHAVNSPLGMELALDTTGGPLWQAAFPTIWRGYRHPHPHHVALRGASSWIQCQVECPAQRARGIVFPGTYTPSRARFDASPEWQFNFGSHKVREGAIAHLRPARGWRSPDKHHPKERPIHLLPILYRLAE